MRKPFQFITARNKRLRGSAFRISIIAVACLFLSATQARADTFTFTYTGNDFTTVVSPYTTSDHITGTIVLRGPLPANLSLTNETSQLLSYSFSDGFQTLNDVSTDPLFVAGLVAFDLATNGAGVITAWNVEFSSLGAPGSILTTTTPTAVDQGEFLTELGSEAVGSRLGAAGVWTTVPEPGTLSMILSGLLGLGLLVSVKLYRGNRPTETRLANPARH